MVKLSRTKLAAAVGGLALSLTTGIAVASADPDLSSVINTTCTYDQAFAALNAIDPEAARALEASTLAQSWLRSFFAAPVDQRQRMVQQTQSIRVARQYAGLITQITSTCHG